MHALTVDMLLGYFMILKCSETEGFLISASIPIKNLAIYRTFMCFNVSQGSVYYKNWSLNKMR